MRPIKLNIKTKNETYPIIIGNDLTKKLQSILKKNSITFNQCLLIIDKRVPKKILNKIIRSLKNKKIFKYYFDSSEKKKSLKKVNEILKNFT